MAQTDMLSSILNDPEKLQSALAMASSLLGGDGGASLGGGSAPPPAFDAPPAAAPAMSMPPPPKNTGGSYDPSAELMQRAMPVIAEIARSGQNAVSREKANLLNAVKPFVAENISAQIDHGMRLVSMARMARSVLRQFGVSTQVKSQDGGGVTRV